MKTSVKTTYLSLSVGLMLSSCSQEDAPAHDASGGDRRIVFNTSFPEVTTRATEITSDLAYFRMTAFDESDETLIEDGHMKEYIDHLLIDKEEGSAKAISDLCVWPQQGQESDILHFFAFYPELPSEAMRVNTTAADKGDGDKTVGLRIADFHLEKDIAYQMDFVTAYASGSMADNLFSGISLGFRHQLSRIEIKAKGSHKSCDIEIAGVRIANVPMRGTLELQTSPDADGVWKEISTGDAEYIFREGDDIFTVATEPASILGSRIDSDNDNCAMLIPAKRTGWAYTSDTRNESNGMYLDILLRILDKTPTGNRKQQYPYSDNSQGLNALNIPKVYMAVDKATGKSVARRLYRDGDTYFTDEACSQAYTIPANEEVKEFGWAALPISGDWQSGSVYTYTLDYTYGVGVHGPDVEGSEAPRAGDPIISDKVGVSVSFKPWKSSTQTGVEVPEK